MQWYPLIAKATFWLTLELLLGWIGIDDLSDYSEFIAKHRRDLLYRQQVALARLAE